MNSSPIRHTHCHRGAGEVRSTPLVLCFVPERTARKSFRAPYAKARVNHRVEYSGRTSVSQTCRGFSGKSPQGLPQAGRAP
jgi:hypothetical protein